MLLLWLVETDSNDLSIFDWTGNANDDRERIIHTRYAIRYAGQRP
jgi:hypothetical protein